MRDDRNEYRPESPISLSHLVHTITAYRAAIAIALAAVALAYAIFATLLYLRAPSQRITTLPFRLEFEGARTGEYPNGTKFSPAEIVATPVLLNVFNDNRLDRFTTFGLFTRSVFVLESNPEFDALASEYQARLSDPKLTAVDRERLQREFDLKRQSLSKNQYALSYSPAGGRDRIPADIVPKLLNDTLAAWARIAVNEQHVLRYRVAVLSPNIFTRTPAEEEHPVIATHVLRSKILRVLGNIAEISDLPAAELARTAGDDLSLAEIAIRLEELIRFRLEPLLPVARTASGSSAATVQFLESQLAHDERLLRATRERADGIRQALAVYALNQRVLATDESGSASGPRLGSSTTPMGSAETIMPQLSDSFIDRLVALTSNAADTSYRQKMVEEYREATLAAIPLEQAVAYDEHALNEVSGSGSTGVSVDITTVRNRIEEARAEARHLVGKVNELHRTLSRNLSPSTELYALTGTTVTRTIRARSVQRLALWGVLMVLFTLPVAVLAALLHNRVREEDAMEKYDAAGDLP